MNVNIQQLLDERREAQTWNSMDDEPFKQVEKVLVHLVALGFDGYLTDSFGSNQWWEFEFIHKANEVNLYIHRDWIRATYGDAYFKGSIDAFIADPSWKERLT